MSLSGAPPPPPEPGWGRDLAHRCELFKKLRSARGRLTQCLPTAFIEDALSGCARACAFSTEKTPRSGMQWGGEGKLSYMPAAC